MLHFLTYHPSLFKHLSFVNKHFCARCKERCWLLSQPLTNDWLHLCILCKFLPIYHFLTSKVYCSCCKTLVAINWIHFKMNLSCMKYFCSQNKHFVCYGTDNFSGNIVLFNVDKWRHNNVILTKLTSSTKN